MIVTELKSAGSHNGSCGSMSNVFLTDLYWVTLPPTMLVECGGKIFLFRSTY